MCNRIEHFMECKREKGEFCVLADTAFQDDSFNISDTYKHTAPCFKFWHANFISIKANKANKGRGPQQNTGGNRS
jgi:hypothetical protein